MQLLKQLNSLLTAGMLSAAGLLYLVEYGCACNKSCMHTPAIAQAAWVCLSACPDFVHVLYSRLVLRNCP